MALKRLKRRWPDGGTRLPAVKYGRIDNAGNAVFAESITTVNNYPDAHRDFEAAERSESKSVTVSAKVTASQNDLLNRMADEYGISKSAMLHDALELWCAMYPDNYQLLGNLEQIQGIVSLVFSRRK